MLCWLTVELLIAAVIVVITCRMRRYWLGGVLVFLLWPLSSWLVPRPKKRKSVRVFSHSPNGISLGRVLTQVGK